MKTLDFLVMLRERDIHVWAEGDRLRCNAPAGVMTPELRQELQLRKGEILHFLRSAESLAQQQRAIVPLQPDGTATPIFATGGHNGDVFCFRALARQMGADQPFFGLQPPGLDGHREPLTRVEDLAAYFADQIRVARPDGPYIIAGYCAGGTIAFELARQLLHAGAAVSCLVLFGSPFPTSYRLLPRLRQSLGEAAGNVARHSRALASLPAAERRKYVSERWRNFNAERTSGREAAQDPVMVLRDKVGHATLAAIRRYSPSPFSGRLCLFWPNTECSDGSLKRWSAVAQHAETYFGPPECNGSSMLSEQFAGAFVELFRGALAESPDGKGARPPSASARAPRQAAGEIKPLPLESSL